MMYVPIPLLFSVLSPCPSPPSLPSRPSAACSRHMSLVLLKLFFLLKPVKMGFFLATAACFNRCYANKTQVEVHLIKRHVEADKNEEEEYSLNWGLKH